MYLFTPELFISFVSDRNGWQKKTKTPNLLTNYILILQFFSLYGSMPFSLPVFLKSILNFHLFK